MAVLDPNAQSPEGNRDSEVEATIDEVHMLIEKCLQLYMDRKETASMLEIHYGIQRLLTRLVWDQLELCNPEFFRNYYTRLVLKQQIVGFNELLEQQCRAMNIPVVPAELQTSMELEDTAPWPDSPWSEISYENEAESNKLPTNLVGFFGSEEVAGSNPKSMLSGGDHIANSMECDRPLRIMARGLSYFDPNPEAPDQQGDDSTLDQGSPSADL